MKINVLKINVLLLSFSILDFPQSGNRHLVKIKTTLFARFEFECVFARNFKSDDLCYQKNLDFVPPWILLMPVRSAFLSQHQTCKKLRPRSHWSRKYFLIVEGKRLESRWICGKYQIKFYEWLLFDMMTVEILQLMYQKGLNQLDFLWFL